MSIVRGIVLSILAILLAACREEAPRFWQGYAEGEYVRISAPVAGTLLRADPQRGDRVELAAPMFILEQVNEAAGRREAAQRLDQARARLANLEKGRRPDEIAAIQAQERQARAALALSGANLKRAEQLLASGFQSPASLDEARSAHDRDQARLAEFEAQLKVARLTARPDEIDAAHAEVAAADAALAQADWRLTQKAVRAPVAGTVQDRLYLPGEFVPAGYPVYSILPPENIKLRFFVPQAQLAALRPGMALTATCDGCGGTIGARLSFIAPQPEYTPPVIYNRDNRAKLVYLVEARPNAQDALRLHPGQPVDVRQP
jgi:HlyD family secretion protein